VYYCLFQNDEDGSCLAETNGIFVKIL